MNHLSHLLYFEDEANLAHVLAQELGLVPEPIHQHRFPDGEHKLRLPSHLSGHVGLLRSLHQPNEKLTALMLSAHTARELGAQRLSLIAPYLCYMRQDIAFEPGEAVSQRIVGQFLSSLFDAVITVDPHLHRTASLSDVMPHIHTQVLSAAPLLSDWIATQFHQPLLMGPDSESVQWVSAAAQRHGFDFSVCEKLRHGDHSVAVQLPRMDVQGRAVVLMDDIASSGQTLAVAARQLLAAGAASVDVAVTHALFAGDALEVIAQSGVRHVWSTDCIQHASNVVSVGALLAQTLKSPEGSPS